jgi:hypothetical protein
LLYAIYQYITLHILKTEESVPAPAIFARHYGCIPSGILLEQL